MGALRRLASLFSMAATLAALAAAFTGCSSPGEPGDDGAARIVIEAGANATDTILSEPTQALIVRIKGQTTSGLVVRFEPLLISQNAYVLVSPLAGASFTVLAVDTTDASGKAATRIKLGSTAGEASLRIIVPELGLADSARFTVRPGAVASVRAAPQDTTLLPTATFTARATVRDRYDNPRGDPVTFSGASPLVSVAGATVTAVRAGRGRVLARSGAVVDTLFVSIVPDGILAAVSAEGLVQFRTDGTGIRRILAGPLVGLTADWAPGGNEIALDTGGDQPIRVVDVGGGIRPLTVGGVVGAGFEIYPEFSPDGQWLYYSENAGGWRIRRVHRDGTADTVLVALTGLDVAPSPSPDGTRLAYVVAGLDQLRLYELTTGTNTVLAPVGHTPAWSPDGNLIAFVVGGQIWVAAPNGSGRRRVTGVNDSYGLGIDWSPDGQWLVAKSYFDRIELIEVATGTVLRLGYTAGWSAPTWKPIAN